MRHGKKFNHLSRTTSHRKALLANLSNSLLRHKRIYTTTAKAKALRKYIEPLITRSKSDTTHSRRMVFSHLRDKQVLTELYSIIAEKVAQRPGGYTRIIRLERRKGDAAEKCLIELVDFNTWTSENKQSALKTKRTRRGSRKSTPNDTPSSSTQVSSTQDFVQSASSEPTEKDLGESQQTAVQPPESGKEIPEEVTRKKDKEPE